MEMKFTEHARTRQAQRHISDWLIEMILSYGRQDRRNTDRWILNGSEIKEIYAGKVIEQAGQKAKGLRLKKGECANNLLAKLIGLFSDDRKICTCLRDVKRIEEKETFVVVEGVNGCVITAYKKFRNR
jgi:hypothetical protein